MTHLKRLASWFNVRIRRGNPLLRVGWGILAFFVLFYAFFVAVVYEVIHAIDRSSRLGERGQWLTAILVAILGATAISGATRTSTPASIAAAPTATPFPTFTATGTATPTSTPTATPTSIATVAASSPNLEFEIRSPASGSTETTAMSVVQGVAPPGATVVQDIGFAADQSTVAGGDGSWSLIVNLNPGPNELVFRIGGDRSTERRLTIVLLEPTAAPTSEPTPEAVTPEPTTDSPPAPVFATIGDGTWEVGVDIKPGTYRLREPTSCYWARLKGFGGGFDEIIANELVSGFSVVTIGKNDKGFESNSCGEWTKDLSRVTDSRTEFSDGTFIVRTDIKPGTYRNHGGETCNWARLKGFGGSTGHIISNHLGSGSTVVTIKSTDKGFTSRGCGIWKPK